MTDSIAGDRTPPSSAQPSGRQGGPRETAVPRIRVSTVSGFLSVVPHLLGFHPSRSIVVVGLDGPRGRIKLGFRYDLPDPPDPARSREIARHAVEVMRQRRVTTAIAAGYGPGTLVTPVADALRAAARGTSITLRDVLRVEGQRYWSYLCQEPRCCPPEGTPFDGPDHPNARALTAAGMTARPDRESLAASVAPVTGGEADSMRRAHQRALRRAAELITGAGTPDRLRPLVQAGRAAVRDAIARYQDGGEITDHDQMAWLIVTVADLRVRDDAWARMAPEHSAAHRRLWTDATRRAAPAYAAAPASLLAFAAWQCGEGALANIAVERALEDDPEYSMAHLIGHALEAGLPPSVARLPMTPEEVEASYERRERPRGGAERRPRSKSSGSRARKPAGEGSAGPGSTTPVASKRPSG
jgi:hypothetical protein